jgi:lipoate-protein ligase A
MAVDVALARHRRPGEGVLRFYRWTRPTLSLGRHQSCELRYDPLAARGLGVEIVRRPTGGREVLHDRELTYAVIAPFAGPGSLRLLYAEINDALLHALALLGVSAERAPATGRVPSPNAGACFARPAPGEIMVGGRKLVGSAQVRIGPTILQHGSILLRPASVALGALARNGQPVLHQEGAYLAELLGPKFRLDDVVRTFTASFAGAFGGDWAVASGLRPEEEETVAQAMAMAAAKGAGAGADVGLD